MDKHQVPEHERAESEALDWFVCLREAPQDPDLKARFASWYTADSVNAEEFDKLEDMWSSEAFADALGQLSQREMSMVNASVAHAKRNRWRWAGFLAAAMVVFGLIGWLAPDLWIKWRADFYTKAGEQLVATLPDGSEMTLNTASAVVLDFAQNRRHVELLKGEAFFDVTHDPQHPFTVTGGATEVTVLGTAFSYRTEANFDEAVLERGRVMFSLRNLDEAAQLSPGEVITATHARLDRPVAIDPETYLEWREGRVHIDDLSLTEALRELQRYHSGMIILANTAMGEMRVSGDYRIEDIAQAVRTLADVAGLSLLELPGGNLILI